ncbi:MAG: hypothetical protein JRD93_08435 [Deltaproteobacteria bacterium]|nr:hypothetical protein [Deltaproteobacteria bacterium]MBW2661995.1 hypothetical protein [Deltaproteobacteria bacterium]
MKMGMYTSRNNKYAWVYDRFKKYLINSVLDIGACECKLREYLVDTRYVGVDKNDGDISLDLDKETIPGTYREYHIVLCLDVLEHLENIHSVFDRICYLADRYVLISLPNCYNSIISFIRAGKYSKEINMKFYGLPIEPPSDRHRWFFSGKEAYKFVKARGVNNGFELVEMIDTAKLSKKGMRGGKLSLLKKLMFWNPKIKGRIGEFEGGTLFFLLERVELIEKEDE